MTVAVPIHHPEAWQNIAFQAAVENPLMIHQTGPRELTPYCEYEIRTFKVRFVQDAEAEEHEANMLPRWQNQIIRTREAFGREMIPDDSQSVEDGVGCVKSADGSLPDPTFEMVMYYTFGDDPMEHHARVHRDDTPAVIREGLKRMHPGKAPAEMLIDGTEVDDDWPMSEWMTRTGKSHIAPNGRMEKEYQKFWLWTPKGEKDLGDEELEGRQPNEIWAILRTRNLTLMDIGRSRIAAFAY
jgi:hypothetical protein